MNTTDITREQGWALLTEFVKSESLRRHCLSVETAMRAYAAHYGEDVEAWGLVGLIHDFDFEIHPTLDKHPQDGAPILRERGYPEWIVRAVLSHGEHLGIARESRLEKTLLGCDELTGFIQAVAFVQPTKSLADVTVQSVMKKMKDKAFARGCNRDDIRLGAEELGMPLEQHAANCIAAMQAIAPA